MVGITKMKVETRKRKKSIFLYNERTEQAWPGTDSDTVSVT